MALYYLKASGKFQCGCSRMGTKTSGSEYVAKDEDFHLSGVCEQKQVEQTYCVKLQSNHDQQASRSNRGTDSSTHWKAHATDGDPNQEHHMNEIMSLIKSNKKQPSNQTNDMKRRRNERQGTKSKMMPLFAPCQSRGWWVLEVRNEQTLLPTQLEVCKEHLEVHGAHRIRYVTTGESDIE